MILRLAGEGVEAVPQDALVIATAWPGAQRATTSGAPTPRELLAPYFATIDRSRERLLDAWRTDRGGQDLTACDGLSLGRAHDEMIWIACLLPAVRAGMLARRAFEVANADTLACDSSVSWFLRRALRELAADTGRSFVVEGETAAAGAANDFIGPSLAWTPTRSRPFRDGPGPTLFSMLAAPFRARTARPRLLMEYYPSLEPLFAQLAEPRWRKTFDLEMLQWPPRRLARRYLAAGIPVVSHPGPDGLDRRTASEILRRWRLDRRPATDPAWWLDGVGHEPVARDAIEAYLAANLARSVADLRNARRVLVTRRPAALILPIDSMPRQRVWIDVARTLGIPSIVVIHGIGIPAPGLSEGFHADFLATECPGTARLFAAAGRPAASIVPVGAGFLDGVESQPPPSCALRRRVLLLSNPPALFVARSLPGDAEQYLVDALTALAGIDVEVTVRIHPSESESYHRKLLSPFPGVTLSSGGSFRQELAGHGIVVGGSSTAMVEAMIAGRHVIGINWNDLPLCPPFDESSEFPMTRSAAEFKTRLENFLADDTPPDHAAFLDSFVGPRDGRQAERFLNWLEERFS